MLSQVLSTCVLIDSAEEADVGDPDSPSVSALVRNCNRFSVRYFKNCRNSTVNTLCSPVAVQLGLASFYQVSGESIDEDFRTVIQLPNDKSTSNIQHAQLFTGLTQSAALKIHTMLCMSNTRTLDARFRDHLANHAPPITIEPVDFTDDVLTAYAVNVWIQTKRCQIDDLIAEGDVWSLEPQSMMMFNAVVLMTRWKWRFDPKLTVSKEFKFLNKVQSVPMMHGILKASYCHDQELKCKILELPFEQSSNYDLLIILPDQDRCLAEVAKEISEDFFNDLRTKLMDRWVDIEIPTFNVAMKQPVKKIMGKLNCGGIFETKELKVFSEGKNKLDRFFQHCAIKVGEDGAETPDSLPESPPDVFIADRPFMFAVRKVDDNMVVLIGDYSSYVDPDEQF